MLFTYLIVLLLIFIYSFVQRRFNYWSKKNVPFLKPLPIFGNYKDYVLLKASFQCVTQNICTKFPDAPYVGSFFGMDPTLIVKDPELIKLITTEDFYFFNYREISDYTHKEVLTQNLFFTQGDRWRVLRQNLTALFTSAKMKNMFHLIKKCSITLEDLMDRELRNSQEIDVTDLAARFTIDCISSCVFGVDVNVMGTDSTVDTNPFMNISKQIFEVSNVVAFKVRARAMWPRIIYGLGLKAFSVKVNNFFHKFITEVFSSRQYKPSTRNDFVDLLLSLANKKEIVGDSMSNLKTGGKKIVRLEMNDDLLVAQCVLLFGAGYETSSHTLSFILYELAKNEDAQRRAIAEVDNYFQSHENDIEYDCVTDLPYTLACIDETLRLYPVLGVNTREVVEDYTLPTGLKLEKGIRIHIPVMYLHMNPDYFPDPNEFRPERFLGEAMMNIKPYTFMPFGVGQRYCIGNRFAKMQLMAALIPILKKYKLQLAAGISRSVPLEVRSITQHPVENIRLLFIPRN